MSHGESIRKICADADMPNASTIFAWIAKHEEFSKQYARAAEARADALFEEVLEIADDNSEDYRLIERDGEQVEIFNSEHVQRSRLRVDTRKWMVGKMQPKKYGDKVQQEISGPDGGPIQTEVSIRPQLSRDQWLALHSK